MSYLAELRALGGFFRLVIAGDSVAFLILVARAL